MIAYTGGAIGMHEATLTVDSRALHKANFLADEILI